MRKQFSKIRLLGATALTLIIVNGLGVQLPTSGPGGSWLGSDRVEAASGGRYRGGSFDRPADSGSGGSYSGGGYSGGGYSGGGYSGGGYSGGGYRVPSRYYPPPGPVYIPPPRQYPPVGIPIPDSGYSDTTYYSDGSSSGFLLLFLLPVGLMVFMTLASAMTKQGRSRLPLTQTGTGELGNDVVTVTRLQVVLLPQARYVQERLTELTQSINSDTKEGLTETLRETVLALLRSPENWTHAIASSQTVRSRQAASQLFEQFSIEERSKFTSETLVNVAGQVRRQTLAVNPEDDPAAFIVVTLLVGTEDDRPLFDKPLRNVDDLKLALRRLGAIPAEYLMIYEMLWTPQDPSDRLSYDELLTGYPGLVQL